MDELDYHGKTVLAPMVRVGTLPMRLLALNYGADIAYTEEIVDYRILQSNRVENEVLGTVDFVSSHEEQPVFRTCTHREKSALVFQVGSSDAERAVKVAKFVENDVSGFDVNMGCPKAFSIQGGMGAALLRQPDKVKEMLTSLVHSVKIPVTCKIRLLDSLEESLEFCQMVERCGVKAVGIHGRRRDERQQHPNRNTEIREIARALNIPVIANGGSREIKCWEDVERFMRETGCSSVMLARAAQENASIFKRDGLLPLDTAVEYDALPQNIKYVIQRMIGDQQQTTERGRNLLASVTQRQICKLWDLEEYFIKTKSRLRERRQRQRRPVLDDDVTNEIFNKSHLIELDIAVPKKSFDQHSPKFVLSSWCRKCKIKAPCYQTVQRSFDKRFRSVLTVENKHFTSTYWERNKKFSEQAAAMVALDFFGLRSLLADDFWDEDIRPV